MKYLKLFESFSPKYIGQCDYVRKRLGGEEFWQELMNNKENISKEEFLANVDTSDILDGQGETIEDFISGDENSYFAKGVVKDILYYFVCTHGFEFIWKK